MPSNINPWMEVFTRFHDPTAASTIPTVIKGTNRAATPQPITNSPMIARNQASQRTERFIETRKAAASRRFQSGSSCRSDSSAALGLG